mmetsp:Transcript_6704/g.20279  ORF Transcript_6704/g.20279 Transcript_6704/m.20279 type:complete len:478 (+) Transcript_6704:1576-3009(+)
MTRPALSSRAESSDVLAAAAAARTRATRGRSMPPNARSQPLRGSDAPLDASERTSVRTAALRTSGRGSVARLSRRPSTGNSAAATASLSSRGPAASPPPPPPVDPMAVAIPPSPASPPLPPALPPRPSARATCASAAPQSRPTAVRATLRSASCAAKAPATSTAPFVCSAGIATRRSEMINRAQANAGCNAAPSSISTTSNSSGRISCQPLLSPAPHSSSVRRQARRAAARRVAPPGACVRAPAAYVRRRAPATARSCSPPGARCSATETARSSCSATAARTPADAAPPASTRCASSSGQSACCRSSPLLTTRSTMCGMAKSCTGRCVAPPFPSAPTSTAAAAASRISCSDTVTSALKSDPTASVERCAVCSKSIDEHSSRMSRSAPRGPSSCVVACGDASVRSSAHSVCKISTHDAPRCSASTCAMLKIVRSACTLRGVSTTPASLAAAASSRDESSASSRPSSTAPDAINASSDV